MRNFTELFEYLKNTNDSELFKEVKLITSGDIDEVLLGVGKLTGLLKSIDYFLISPKPLLKEQDDEILTIAEASSYLKLNEKTVRKLIKQRKIEAFEIGTVDKKDARGTIRVRKSACDASLSNCRI